MKTAAIIAEYNPFHNGHAYQIEQLKTKFGITHVICILNASFMQRGEPAMTDKMLRAESALRCGADLVVELPFVYGAQTAEIFAAGGVGLANLLKADALSFGCENDDLDCFYKIVRLLNHESEAYKTVLKRYLKEGNSYAVSRIRALEEITKEDLGFLSKPNNILALEYLRQIERNKNPMSVIPVLRKNVAYDSEFTVGAFASASYLRRLFRNGQAEQAKQYMPQISFELTRAARLHHADDYRYILKACLAVKEKEQLSEICDMEIGLENRMKEALSFFDRGVESFVAEVSTKRYSKSRIRRMLFHMVFDYKQKHRDFFRAYTPHYVRVLAINEKGRELLKQRKDANDCAIVTNLTKQRSQLHAQDETILLFEEKATVLYHLFDSDIIPDEKRKPFINICEETTRNADHS